ncbi:MAG: hypothetical protein IPL46_16155 [Saprospiraceae bacterium]|nr:hypothetical protein [Saprospiraceae bacterium]
MSEEAEALERYIKGQLTVEERIGLEKRLTEDPELAKRFEEVMLIWQTREVLVADELRKELSRFDRQSYSKNWLKIVIGLIVVSSIIALLFLNSNRETSSDGDEIPMLEPESIPPKEKAESIELPKIELPRDVPEEREKLPAKKKNQQFAMELYQKGPSWSLMRGGEEATDSIQLAIIAYVDENYTTCLSLLGSQDPPSQSVRELQAHSMIHLNRFAEASNILKEISDSGQIPYYERSQWYFILSQVAADKWATEETKKMVNIILADPEHEYHERVKELLNNIFFK